MRPYAELIGDPVADSKSPALHSFWLKALGLDHHYCALRVSDAELGAYFARRREDPYWRGCNVTAPHKEAVLQYLDGLSEAARAIGAVNIVHWNDGRLIGDNSDVDGIAEALPRSAIANKKAAMIGAGGAARAALWHLIKCEVSRVQILTRRPVAAGTFEFARANGPGIDNLPLAPRPDFEGADLIINASPLGSRHLPMPRAVLEGLATAGERALVFDMVYSPRDTDLLKTARELGLQTANGLTMLIGQADKAFQSFFRASPPRNLDEELLSGLEERG